MKMILFAKASLCFALLTLVQVAVCQDVTLKYNGSGSYSYIERTNLRRYDNGKYVGLVNREVRSFIARTSVPAGGNLADSYYDGSFFVDESTRRNYEQVRDSVSGAIPSSFKISPTGELTMLTDYGYPSFRSFPAFPTQKIKIGDKWQAKAERVVDPLNKGVITKMPILVEYTYLQDDVFEGEEVYVFSAQWATRYGLSYWDFGGDKELKSAQGSHKATMYVSKKTGNALVVRDQVDETFVYKDGNNYAFKGTISMFTEYPPAYDKRKLIPALQRVAGVSAEELERILQNPTDGTGGTGEAGSTKGADVAAKGSTASGKAASGGTGAGGGAGSTGKSGTASAGSAAASSAAAGKGSGTQEARSTGGSAGQQGGGIASGSAASAGDTSWGDSSLADTLKPNSTGAAKSTSVASAGAAGTGESSGDSSGGNKDSGGSSSALAQQGSGVGAQKSAHSGSAPQDQAGTLGASSGGNGAAHIASASSASGAQQGTSAGASSGTGTKGGTSSSSGQKASKADIERKIASSQKSPSSTPQSTPQSSSASSEKKVTVESTTSGIRLTMQNLNFKPDSAELLPGEAERLDQIAAVLKEVGEQMFLVEGHTASVGKVAGEKQLSVERANAIAEALVKRGIPRERFICKGSGGTKPVASNSTSQGRAKNRRVEITILE